MPHPVPPMLGEHTAGVSDWLDIEVAGALEVQ